MTRRRFITAALAGTLASCQKRGLTRGDDDGTLERYPLAGEVIRVDAPSGIITIRHGPIANAAGKQWMEAMTMDFPAVNRGELAKFKRGDSIQATVVVRNSDFDYWLEQLRPGPAK